MSLADYKTSSLDLDLFDHGDQDEMYLRNLSVYATLRPGDLKGGVQTDIRTSVDDLIQRWQRDQSTEPLVTETKELELRDNELKVKGFEIDSRIAPGFRYSVRYIGKDEYIFNGEARRLESIGLGYGRRLTFKGDQLNLNDCYFWTDSNQDGYAFNIEAIREGDEFVISDSEHHQIGTVAVQQVEVPQIELDTEINGSTIVKNVRVRFGCFVKQNNNRQLSLVNINKHDFEVVEGIAELVKEKGCKEATVRSVKDVHFQSLGKCTLHCLP